MDFRKSYSQCGEDLIADFVFHALGIQKPSYLDVGAYLPVELSNTYMFYRKGARGVCVEPNVAMIAYWTWLRPGDTFIPKGIVPQGEESATLYIMSSPGLSTTSEINAKGIHALGHNRIRTENKILTVHWSDMYAKMTKPPDFLSMDTEGSEEKLLAEYDFEHFRPKVICLETLTYSETKDERKRDELLTLVKDHGYFVYADTYINTIFVDQDAWRQR